MGKLAPELIQSVVRRGFGDFRLCYEQGMKRNPKLAGRVATKFLIRIDGRVSTSELDCTTLPDDEVVDCIVHRFAQFVFPPPDGGPVAVVYPIMFNPSR